MRLFKLIGIIIVCATVNLTAAPQTKITIVLAGDSTVTDHAGWGAAFAGRFVPAVKIINLAKGGASSKNFWDGGYWKPFYAAKADYVFIQFGHNDCPGKGPKRETDPQTSYQENLKRYVAEARAQGTKPILLSPMTRRRYRDGKIASILTPYAAAVRSVAKTTKTPMINLHQMSVELCNRLGPQRSAELGPEGDATHFNSKGAEKMTDLILSELPRVAPKLSEYLRN